MENSTLNKLPIGKTAKIEKIEKNCELYKRLTDIGLISGTDVQCILKSPLGDPCAYLIRGSVIAIRECDCKNVSIIY